jgi:hypothetical protein
VTENSWSPHFEHFIDNKNRDGPCFGNGIVTELLVTDLSRRQIGRRTP